MEEGYEITFYECSFISFVPNTLQTLVFAQLISHLDIGTAELCIIATHDIYDKVTFFSVAVLTVELYGCRKSQQTDVVVERSCMEVPVTSSLFNFNVLYWWSAHSVQAVNVCFHVVLTKTHLCPASRHTLVSNIDIIKFKDYSQFIYYSEIYRLLNYFRQIRSAYVE